MGNEEWGMGYGKWGMGNLSGENKMKNVSMVNEK